MRLDNVSAREKKNMVYYDMKNNLFKKERLARYNFASKFACNMVLEVGCGARDGALMLSKYAKDVVAIDISKEAVEFAKRNYTAPNIKYMAMDCLDMGFKDNYFDAVISLEVIEHVFGFGRATAGEVHKSTRDKSTGDKGISQKSVSGARSFA